MGSPDEYDIEDATTPIHRAEEWRNLSPEDRRRMAVSFYYAILGLCQKKSIRHCAASDAKFIAKVCCSSYTLLAQLIFQSCAFVPAMFRCNRSQSDSSF